MKTLLAALLLATQTIPIQFAGHRIVIPVTVGDHAPASFILDTGASRTSLDKDYAARIGIAGNERTTTIGAGGGPLDVALARDVSVRFGDHALQLDRAALIPFANISLRLGRAMDGVLGAEAFAAYVVELDYQNSEVTFHDRAAFQSPAHAVRLPIKFDGALPVIRAKLTLSDGRTADARLLVDTGAGASIILTAAFTRKQRIALPNAVEFPSGGVGGMTSVRTGRIPRIQLGTIALDDPLTSLSGDTAGALHDPDIDGLLGAEVLRRFTVFADYKRKELLLVPNDALRAPFEADMSGMALGAKDATFARIVVQNVIAGSPAIAAGVRAGDELRAIDGRAVTPAALNEIRKDFKMPGRTFALTIVRDGAEQTIELTTRRMT
jgi:hypothetical protein